MTWIHPPRDHVGGLKALKAATNCQIYGPLNEPIPLRDYALVHGDQIRVLEQWVNVFGVHGHTAGHLAYEFPQEGMLFSGDTLFSAGCGRLFEGTPTQMLTSLDALAALPECTRVFRAHEYTVSNLRFALAVEPENAAIAQRLGEPSLGSRQPCRRSRTVLWSVQGQCAPLTVNFWRSFTSVRDPRL